LLDCSSVYDQKFVHGCTQYAACCAHHTGVTLGLHLLFLQVILWGDLSQAHSGRSSLSSGAWCRSPKHSTPLVSISMCTDRKYWLVNIECKDRNKLLFDTVCTLADLNFEVFHATIDCVNGRAIQEYYVRSRLGFTGAPPSSGCKVFFQAWRV